MVLAGFVRVSLMKAADEGWWCLVHPDVWAENQGPQSNHRFSCIGERIPTPDFSLVS
jgi:hypothetical protein